MLYLEQVMKRGPNKRKGEFSDIGATRQLYGSNDTNIKIGFGYQHLYGNEKHYVVCDKAGAKRLIAAIARHLQSYHPMVDNAYVARKQNEKVLACDFLREVIKEIEGSK